MRSPLVLSALLAGALPAQQSRSPVVAFGRTCGPVLSATVILDGTNRDLTVSMAGAPPSTFGFHVFGLQRTDIRLPGPGACSLLVLPLGLEPFLVDSQGRARQRYLVPYALGLEVSLQDVVFYRTGPGDAFETTNGLQVGPWQPITTVTEDFTTLNKREPLGTGARWGSGALQSGTMGRSGILGQFQASDGKKLPGKDAQGRDIYEWNTNSITIPGSRTLTGQPITVTNGVLDFMSFVVGPTERVRFVGLQIPFLTATGAVSIQGAVELYVPEASKTYTDPQRGIFGGLGGCGAASGGQGGDSPAYTQGQLDGRPGGDVVAPAGHPRAGQAKGTGGGGGKAHPADGKAASIAWIVDQSFKLYTAMVAAGGAGGSSFDNQNGALLGKPGRTAKTKVRRDFWNYLPNDIEFGPPSTPGIAFPTLPIDTAQASLAHLLIGGSGGGGGGTHAFYSLYPEAKWSPGAGGAGGGGCLALRAGDLFTLAAAASIEARGGSTPSISTSASQPPIPAPGGAGSGGTVLVQSAATAIVSGTIDALGGTGGSMIENTLLAVASYGGDGGAGYIRIETPSVLDWRTLNLKPTSSADNVGQLRANDQDTTSAALSKWYDTGRLPIYHYYVIEAVLDSVVVVFSDNPRLATRRAQPGEPVVFALQSARIDRNGVPLDAPTPWAQGTIDPINDSSARGNGFRFFLALDRSKVIQSVGVRRVRVVIDG